MCLKRVEDLEVKMGVLVRQIEEEKEENAEKIEVLGTKIIRYFGTELWKLKRNLCSFLQEKERKIEEIGKQMASLCLSLQLKPTQSDNITKTMSNSSKST